MTTKPFLSLLLIPLFGSLAGAPPTSLGGSPASMKRQHEVALQRDYTFADDSAAVKRLVDGGGLVPVAGADFDLADVSHPVARPQVLALVNRLATEYRLGCGERLVVTSLVRPTSEQPGNAHKLSVHPAGMAVDLRVSRDARCRKWLEARLLALEEKGEVDATREKNPPHYHVAVLSAAAAPAPAPRASAPSRAEARTSTPHASHTPRPSARQRTLEERTGDGPAAGLTAAALLAALLAAAIWVAVRR